MISVLTDEDYNNLMNQISSLKKELTSLKREVDSLKLSATPATATTPGQEALLDKAKNLIISANIPNFDDAEIERFFNKTLSGRSWYINIIRKCASEDEKTYMYSIAANGDKNKFDKWAADNKFRKMFMSWTQSYIEDYLMRKYEDIEHLKKMREVSTANRMKAYEVNKSAKANVEEGTMTPDEFKSALDDAISAFKKTAAYHDDFTILSSILKKVTQTFDDESLYSCKKKYIEKEGRFPKRATDSIKYDPTMSFQFISRFNNELNSVTNHN